MTRAVRVVIVTQAQIDRENGRLAPELADIRKLPSITPPEILRFTYGLPNPALDAGHLT